MEIKVKVKDIQTFLQEIFGTKDMEPLLLKNISQKTKFHLKKLGNVLIEEQKAIQEQVKTIASEYYTEEVEMKDENGGTFKNEDGTPKVNKVVPADKKEAFEKAVIEINELEVPIQTFSFSEEDFIDNETKKVVATTNYCNIIDVLIYNTEVYLFLNNKIPRYQLS